MDAYIRKGFQEGKGKRSFEGFFKTDYYKKAYNPPAYDNKARPKESYDYYGKGKGNDYHNKGKGKDYHNKGNDYHNKDKGKGWLGKDYYNKGNDDHNKGQGKDYPNRGSPVPAFPGSPVPAFPESPEPGRAGPDPRGAGDPRVQRHVRDTYAFVRFLRDERSKQPQTRFVMFLLLLCSHFLDK